MAFPRAKANRTQEEPSPVRERKERRVGRPPAADTRPPEETDPVLIADLESFPASDPPAWLWRRPR